MHDREVSAEGLFFEEIYASTAGQELLKMHKKGPGRDSGTTRYCKLGRIAELGTAPDLVE